MLEKRWTIGWRRRIRPNIAGKMIKRIMRRPKPTVVRNSSKAPRAACAERVGKMAVAKATPKIPSGN